MKHRFNFMLHFFRNIPNDELKNIAQIEHSGHRSFSNFIANAFQLLLRAFSLTRSSVYTI